MNLQTFFDELDGAGIQLSVEGAKLRCNAPAGALTPELREELRRRKPEIIEFLSAAAAAVHQQRAIVPLQPRGTRTPIYAVAGHNGDVFAYRMLAQHLGPEQPFFGLQPPGLDGASEPLARVEDLAAYFAAQIRSFQPSGPCIIAGYCAGGTVAFELARQLDELGTEIRFLALFACPYPTAYRFMNARRAVRRLALHSRAIADLPSLRERRDYVARLWHGLKAAPTHEPTDTEGDEVSAMREKVERATIAAVRRYLPRRFSGRVRLFFPNREWPLSGLQSLLWRSVAASSETYFGPDRCEMDVMLRGPDTPTFAALFSQSQEQTALPPALRRA